MGNWRLGIVLISLIFTASFYYSNANSCGVVGSRPHIHSNAWVNDTHRGIIWQNETTNIEKIDTTSYYEGTGNREYVSVELVDSRFVLATTALFEQYEENETSLVTYIYVTFKCMDGSFTNPGLTIPINVIDRNTNWPTFILPDGGFVFRIFTPVPPGFELTGCLNDITVRDIDLTTKKNIFEIEENPYFEIDYDPDASTTPKEFKAKLTTKTFIRSLPGPIVLTISATDVDDTGDKSLTSTTEVTILSNTDFEIPEELVFSKTFYLADYTNDNRVVLTEPITLLSGYDELVQFDIEGDFPKNFALVSDPDHKNQLSILVVISLGDDDLMENHIHLIVRAEREHTSGATATVVLKLPEVLPLEFERAYYEGTIENHYLRVPNLILSQGYEGETVTANVINEHSSYFTADLQENTVTLTMGTLDENIIKENSFLNLEVLATTGRTTTTTVVTLEIIKDDNITPVFDGTVYEGTYLNPGGLTHDRIVLVQGYDGINEVTLSGGYSNLFIPKLNGATVTIEAREPISPEIYSRERIVLSLKVRKPRTVGASATVIINLPAVLPLEFERAYYEGTIENHYLRVPNLILSQGYEGETVTANVINEHSSYFTADLQDNTVTLSMGTLDENIIKENSFLNLEVLATTGRTTTTTVVTLEIIKDDNVTPVFDGTVYEGTYSNPGGLTHDRIVLVQGYDGINEVTLSGGYSNLFIPKLNGATVRIEAREPISPEIYSRERIVLSLKVRKPRTVGASATVIINLPADSQTGDDVTFDRVFYKGVIQLNEIRHELITITGYDGTSVQIFGDFSSFFEGRVSDGEVRVQATSEFLTLPTDVTHLALELAAAGARAVLLLNVLQSDVPMIPSVTFSSNSYMLTVGIAQTGIVGRVSAVADNREAITYSLGTDNAHLQTRLSINSEGELYLSAPANSGVYTMEVIATTVITQAKATAPVHLRVEAVTICEDKGIVMHPLIILDRDEEAAHNNLVVLDRTQHVGCHFTLTNHWPTDQTWLYVDENGLHTIAIDREHLSIAFMAVSQLQVELILHCESDSSIREKRSERTERLGPYDYSRNKWIFTDTITYNSRRSLVNLIVNDINDNNPIFFGKEHEPIVVGYPTDELEERILPRSLAELKATDADIGENAALRYSSSESVLAVAPTTGFVHVRSGARLTHDQVLTVTATDQNGQGLSGTIQLMVKLLDLNHIAVVTIRDAFLDDETTVLAQLSDAVGYEVKTLRSVVISDDIHEHVTRNTRETATTRALLQLYVYGIHEREPVTVDRLVTDIKSNAVMASIVSTIPLEDHLEDMNISDNVIILLVSTIVLGVLLFAVILMVAIWFFLRWRKNRNYDELSEENSVTSRNASLGELPEPEVMKPRLNIEDLKKSEMRLQKMLHAPIKEVTVEPMPRKMETPDEAILDLPIHEPSVPIVIQSIDKLKDTEGFSEDEFGEISVMPRKSVVTFNENVERITHVDDNVGDDDSDSDGTVDINVNHNVAALNTGYEIYRL